MERVHEGEKRTATQGVPPGERLSLLPAEDVRATRPYLLSASPLRALSRRTISIASLVALDLAGLALSLYFALAIRVSANLFAFGSTRGPQFVGHPLALGFHASVDRFGDRVHVIGAGDSHVHHVDSPRLLAPHLLQHLGLVPIWIPPDLGGTASH